MPSLAQSNLPNTPTLQTIANAMRAFPELTPLIGTSGWTQEPTISIANDVMQRIFTLKMNWKWNRKNAPKFLSVGLQQDYVTSITDLGWIERCSRIDINNSSSPKPWWEMEGVRDLNEAFAQSTPAQVSWVPNSFAVMGTWQPNTAYPCPYGSAQMATSPIQQFIDANGNILFIDSSSLNLNPFSPGVGQTLPVFDNSYPYGTSGDVEPMAEEANAPAGTKVSDGSVIWTVADPNGVAFRFNAVPAQNGIAWLVCPVYQKQAPILTSLQQSILPIPADHAYLFRQGFLAFAQDYAGSKKAESSYARFEESLMMALRGDDREQEETSMVPSDSMFSGGGNGPGYGYSAVGPAWPF